MDINEANKQITFHMREAKRYAQIHNGMNPKTAYHHKMIAEVRVNVQKLKDQERSSWKQTYAPETEDSFIKKTKNPGKIFNEEDIISGKKPERKKIPMGSDYAARRRKERLANNGRMDETNYIEHLDEMSPERAAGLAKNAYDDAMHYKNVARMHPPTSRAHVSNMKLHQDHMELHRKFKALSEEVDQIDESKEDRKAKARAKALEIIRSGKGSEELRRKLAKIHGIEHGGTSAGKTKEAPKPAEKKPEEKKTLSLTKKEPEKKSSSAKDLRALNAARVKAALEKGTAHGARVAGGAGSSNKSPVDSAGEKKSSGLGSSPAEDKEAKEKKKEQENIEQNTTGTKKLSGKVRFNEGNVLSLVRKIISEKTYSDGRKNHKKTVTGQPRNRIDVDPKIVTKQQHQNGIGS